ncbi:MAG: hypothetical protein LIO76_01390 [Clostridiales bacterium]|nr:hypothetical protein [Clostridiales bacterium]
MKFGIRQIEEILRNYGIKYEIVGDKDTEVSYYCPLNQLKDNSITWVRNISDVSVPLMNSIQNVILVAELGKNLEGAVFPVIYAENAHRTFFRIVQHLFMDADPEMKGARIERTAIIETSKIGNDLYVGHHTYIGKDVIIGNHVRVMHNVVIQGKVEIGSYTVIESGTTIGACGFGHYNDEDGNPVCVPHFGGVKIGEHVKIGANNAISRGCLADTVIEDYVKTDNLCHIAHNDHIKHGAMLTAGTIISGSTTVGENVWLAPGTLLNNAITVGDNAFLGIGAVATKSIPEGVIAAGVPAKILRNR